MAKDDRWRPFADALSTYVNGVELDQLSVADFLTYDDAASENDWRLPAGYGAFIQKLGASLPAALATRVTSITHDSRISLETDRGTLRAKSAIVTISSAALASDAIRFSPALNEYMHAAANLPLGLADKVFLSLAEPRLFEPETHLLGSFDRADTGSYYIRPMGHPVIECFLGGAAARALEGAGEAAAIDFCIGQLHDLLGADIARTLSPLAVTAWAKEPTILGSYSHARPGFAAARTQLAQPVSEFLCFAGEACSAQDFSTIHGAWSSGIAAADWIAKPR
jgi:monoamine oxidase